ncbi:hypothetical protein HN371_00230 [Candidatus Poribacteria bacterium]|jgi:hypothetical protein|nr:hypothetical protein [Candidatus Poribacteria bacterium]MBT7096609.1 hypothetical protein [Candidatus Poribacteria bacterium]
MTPEEIEIAREMADHPDWTWSTAVLVRHRTLYDVLWTRIGEDGLTLSLRMSDLMDDPIPDLDDPATQGVVLAQVRERLEWRHAHVVPVSAGGEPGSRDWAADYWSVSRSWEDVWAMTNAPTGPTYGAALGRAWLASREKP